MVCLILIIKIIILEKNVWACLALVVVRLLERE